MGLVKKTNHKWGAKKEKFHMGLIVNYYRPLTSEAVAKKNWIFSVLKNDFGGALIGVLKPQLMDKSPKAQMI